MAKFTIFKPPSGHSLHIPTVAEMLINLTFSLEDVQYLADGCNLKAILPDSTVLIFDNLLNAASGGRDMAPQILQPDMEIINTYDLLLALGLNLRKPPQARDEGQNWNNNFTNGSMIDELLNSSLDMEQSWQKEIKASSASNWANFFYILPTPANKLPTHFHVRLSRIPRGARAGGRLSLGLDFIDLQNENQLLNRLLQPLTLYLIFTPGTENYSMHNFIDWENLSLSGGTLINKEWERNQQNACLLKLVVAGGEIPPDHEGTPRLWLHLPLYDNYLKGVTCSIALAAAISYKMREGGTPGGQIAIEPNYEARVLYSSPQSAEAFSFTNRSLDMEPPNVAIRALNFDQGDFVIISQMLEALGPAAGYQIKPQGDHILILVGAGEKKYRISLENISLETMLNSGSFIAIDAAPPEWLTSVYISESYLQANAIGEATTVLTVKTLLDTLLKDEDYLSIRTLLNQLGNDED